MFKIKKAKDEDYLVKTKQTTEHRYKPIQMKCKLSIRFSATQLEVTKISADECYI